MQETRTPEASGGRALHATTQQTLSSLSSEIVGESKLLVWLKGPEAHAKPFFLWPAYFSTLNENRHRIMREGQPQGEGITRLHLSGAGDETAADRQVLNRA